MIFLWHGHWFQICIVYFCIVLGKLALVFSDFDNTPSATPLMSILVVCLALILEGLIACDLINVAFDKANSGIYIASHIFFSLASISLSWA